MYRSSFIDGAGPDGHDRWEILWGEERKGSGINCKLDESVSAVRLHSRSVTESSFVRSITVQFTCRIITAFFSTSYSRSTRLQQSPFVYTASLHHHAVSAITSRPPDLRHPTPYRPAPLPPTMASPSPSEAIDSLPSSPTTSSFTTSEEVGESDAEREWRESIQQIELLLTMVLVPYVGKYFGRKCAYWGE